MTVTHALEEAESLELDLVLVDEGGDCVPVCKIMDYQKYMYDRQKKEKKQHKRKIKTKEYRLRPKTAYHDVDTLINKSIKNFKKGHRAVFSMHFKKRELGLKNDGYEKLDYVVDQLEGSASLDKKAEDRTNIKYFFNPHKQ